MDRATLKEAIFWLRNFNVQLEAGGRRYHRDFPDMLATLAEAHLATLPRTKMVEVWRVEMAEKTPLGWKAIANTFESHADAARDADFMRREPGFSCVRVTGPHMQCVPA